MVASELRALAPAETLSPEDFAAQVEALVLRLGERLRRGGFGTHASLRRGSTGNFVEHRPYHPGDEIRWLDWRVLARSDRYRIREREHESRLRCDLLLDRSMSMHYPLDRPREAKLAYAARLLAALAALAHAQGDSVSLYLADDEVEVLPRGAFDALHFAGHWMKGDPRRSGHTRLQTCLESLATLLPKGGLLVLASDLLDPDPHALLPLRLLRTRALRVVVLHLLHPEERELPALGLRPFIDLEEGGELLVDTAAQAQSYARAMKDFLEQCRRACEGAAVDYFPVSTGEDAFDVLSRLLAELGRART